MTTVEWFTPDDVERTVDRALAWVPGEFYRILADWNGDGQYDHPMSDVTDYVMSMSWNIGAGGAPPTRDAAGTGTITVDNSTARFSPSNAGGPLFGKLVPGVRIKIQMRAAASDGWRVKFTGYTQSFAARLGVVRDVNTTVITAYGVLSRLTRAVPIYPLIENLSSGAACELILSEMSVPAIVDPGLTSLGKWWSVGKQPALDALREIEDEELGRICEDETGAVLVFDRNHNWIDPRAKNVQQRFGDESGLPIWNLTQEEPQSGIFNTVSIPVRQINNSPENSVLAVISDVQGRQGGRPVMIPAEGETTVKITPENPVVKWGMVDFEANSHIDRSGLNMTPSVTASVIVAGGTTRTVRFVNAAPYPAYLVLLRQLGTSIVEDSAFSVDAQGDETSIDRYGEREFPAPGAWCLSDVDAQAKADHLMAVFSTPRQHITFQVRGNYSDDCIAEIIERKIGDRIHVSAGEAFGLYIDGDFIIDEIRHSVTPQHPMGLHTATYRATIAPTLQLGPLGGESYPPNVVLPPYQPALETAEKALLTAENADEYAKFAGEVAAKAQKAAEDAGAVGASAQLFAQGIKAVVDLAINADGTIAAGKVVDASIAEMSAGKIQGIIAARALERLTQGRALNLDPMTQDASVWELPGMTLEQDPNAPNGGTRYRPSAAGNYQNRLTQRFFLDRRLDYRLSGYFMGVGANGAGFIGLELFDANGAHVNAPGDAFRYYTTNSSGISNNVWSFGDVLIRGSAIPAAARSARITIISCYNGTAGYHVFCNIVLEEIIPNDLILQGTIHGDRMIANTIGAREIVVGNLQNLIKDGDFEDGLEFWTANSAHWTVGQRTHANDGAWAGMKYAVGITGTATGTYIDSPMFPVITGRKYCVSAMIYVGAAVNAVLSVRFYNAAGTLLGTDQETYNNTGAWWYRRTFFTDKAPVNAVSATLRFQNTGAASANIAIGNVSVRESSATTIEPDGITAPMILAGEVTADKIFGTTLGAIKGELGEVTAGIITSTTIKGGEITGAKIQTTEDENQGLKITDKGMWLYNASGSQTMYLDAATGNITLVGRIISQSNLEENVVSKQVNWRYTGSIFINTVNGNYAYAPAIDISDRVPAGYNAIIVKIRPKDALYSPPEIDGTIPVHTVYAFVSTIPNAIVSSGNAVFGVSGAFASAGPGLPMQGVLWLGVGRTLYIGIYTDHIAGTVDYELDIVAALT